MAAEKTALEWVIAVAPIAISGAVFWIGGLQYLLARRKVRLDLYNRRFEIVNSVYDFYPVMIGWEATDADRAARTRFFKAVKKAHFLFDKKSGVAEAMERLDQKSLRVIGFKEHGDNYKSDPKFYLGEFNTMQELMTKGFDDDMNVIRKGVAKYLNFHNI